MKKTFPFLIGCQIFAACSTASLKPAADITDRLPASVSIDEMDLVGGYLVARSSSGNFHAVEMQLKKMSRVDGLLVTSYKEATMDSGPSKSCQGNAILNGSVATVNVVCSPNEYVFHVDFGKADLAALEKGTSVGIQSQATGGQWIPYNFRKRATPYFK